MKDVFSYPKTLRNYDDDKNPNSKKITFIDKINVDRKNVYLSTYSPRQNILQQDHYVNEDRTLTNNSQIVTKKSTKSKVKGKGKGKSKSKQSHFTNAIKQSLSNKAITFQQIGPQNILHCKSLQKLQIISNDRSEEIKILINQKALLFAENQELKMKLINPTYREQQYVQKIVKQELQIENLKETLKRKEQKIIEIQSQHKLQIQRLKKNFQQQLGNLRGGMHQVSQNIPEKRRDSQKVYYTHTTSNQANPIRQIVQPASYQIEPTSVNSIGAGIYKISHSNDYKSSLNPVVINSTNLSSYSPKKQALNDSKQQFQTYVGEDGYERRVYYKNTGNQKVDSYRGEPERIKIFANQGNQVHYNQSSTYGTFTNTKISSYVSKQPEKISSVNKYSSSQNLQSSQQNDTKLHNQNLYSQSLTFQCFNDQN